jgi:hypothetical protein
MTTKTLTPETVLELLQRHVGRDQALRPAEIVELITSRRADPSATRRLRKCIQDLRNQGWPIAAHPSAGYWWPGSAADMEAALRFHWSRAMASLRQISRIKRFGLATLVGQVALPVEPSPPAPLPEGEGSNSSGPPLGIVIAEIPDELHQALQGYLAQHPNRSADWVARQALAMFLLQTAEPTSRDVGAKFYLNNLFEEK